jgi:hypothetical protein
LAESLRYGDGVELPSVRRTLQKIPRDARIDGTPKMVKQVNAMLAAVAHGFDYKAFVAASDRMDVVCGVAGV